MIIKFDNQETQIKEKLLNYLRNEKALFKEIVFPQYQVINLLSRDDNLKENVKRNFSSLKIFNKDGYLLVSRKFQNEDTVIELSEGLTIGDSFQIIAGPCSVEDEKTMDTIAKTLKKLNIKVLRGGTYKPRTSPYDFQGLEEEGLKRLSAVKEKDNLLVVSEILDHNLIDLYNQHVDIFQVGARNMQNYALLKALAKKVSKPIILKRAANATIYEWLMSAEYLMLGGNSKIILCERGLKTISEETRNTLDLSAVLALKKLTHLPVIVDPSHGSGRSDMIAGLSLASFVVGASGVMIEVHPNPAQATSDGFQAISLSALEELVLKINKLKRCL
ncbi:MAG: 3-deoxy-7-phosphoheptulonate synthase [Acholeplasmataceae bacterium]|nr:3-deoxy-7-phosphoheptulonate synthase [Acholeplasmataceae bacterium]